MSDSFNFLSRDALGQYIQRQSWLHQRDPRARLITGLMLLVGFTFTESLWALAGGFLIILLLYQLAKLSAKSAGQAFLRALPFLLFLAILQVFLTPIHQNAPGVLTILGREITTEGLRVAVLLIFRFLALISLLNLLVMSISTAQMTAALFHLLKPFEKMGFPINDLTMVVQVTLRFIPLIAELATRIAKAQAARGAQWDEQGFHPVKKAKRILPLFVPLIINSLKRAQTMALAMDSRGFNSANQRSSFYELRMNGQDWLLILLSLIVSGSLIMAHRFIFL